MTETGTSLLLDLLRHTERLAVSGFRDAGERVAYHLNPCVSCALMRVHTRRPSLRKHSNSVSFYQGSHIPMTSIVSSDSCCPSTARWFRKDSSQADLAHSRPPAPRLVFSTTEQATQAEGTRVEE